MPRLSYRKERFCRGFVEHGNATAAAIEAGYAVRSSRTQGHRLLRDPGVARRIAAIQADLARTSCHDMDVLLGKLEAVYRRAFEDRNLPAAARAVEIQARLFRSAAVAGQPADGAADAPAGEDENPGKSTG